MRRNRVTQLFEVRFIVVRISGLSFLIFCMAVCYWISMILGDLSFFWQIFWSLAGRALSFFVSRCLGLEGGLALAIGFLVRALLTAEGEPFWQNMTSSPSGSPTTSTQAQVGSPLGEERDERHGKESEAGSGTPPSLSDSKRVHPSSGSEADTSFHSCSSYLSSPHSKEVDFFLEPLTSSEKDCWKENIRTLFLDPVERGKPPGLTLEDFGFGKRDAIEILAKNEEARDLVVERLFQPPTKPVDLESCQALMKALRQERWPNAIMAERGSPHAAIYAALEDLKLR
jgi:hypothetical protein